MSTRVESSGTNTHVFKDDLKSFHEKHFGFSNNQSVIAEADGGYQHFGNDTDAEIYPDGAPRTLTVEQIAMFRHSEIHALLRERELRQEAEDETQTQSRESASASSANIPSQSQKDQAAASEPEQASPISLHAPPLVDNNVVNEGKPLPKGDYSQRVWQNKKGRAKEPQHMWTQRRRAREADAAKGESIGLEYD